MDKIRTSTVFRDRPISKNIKRNCFTWENRKWFQKNIWEQNNQDKTISKPTKNQMFYPEKSLHIILLRWRWGSLVTIAKMYRMTISKHHIQSLVTLRPLALLQKKRTMVKMKIKAIVKVRSIKRMIVSLVSFLTRNIHKWCKMKDTNTYQKSNIEFMRELGSSNWVLEAIVINHISKHLDSNKYYLYI